MGEVTGIAWCDHTFNPWWGCQRISPGCERCYAESFAKRVGFLGKRSATNVALGLPMLWGPGGARRVFRDKHWAEPLAWDLAARRAGDRRRVFCASMADVFDEDERCASERSRLFRLIEDTPHLDWLLLTKRAHAMLPLARAAGWAGAWPSNVWAGVTAENAEWAMRRVHHLLDVPADVRFVSYEPAIGSLFDDRAAGLEDVDWIICGGESGHSARPFELSWARQVLDFCVTASVAPFVKQMGSNPHDQNGRLRLRDAKGGDPDEWPEDLRVQEFPRPASSSSSEVTA